MMNSVYFQITGVEVQGLQRVNPDEIRQALDLENLSIVTVDPQAAVEKIAAAYPDLVDIQVSVSFPNIVSFQATERQPVLAWNQGDKLDWIDAEGVVFPARGDAGPLLTIQSDDPLPLAALPVEEVDEDPQVQAGGSIDAPTARTGFLPFGGQEAETQENVATLAGPRKADTVLLEAARALSGKLPAETTIVYRSDNGLGWTDPGGWQVYIGRDLNELETKFLMYQSIASYLSSQGLQPALVSVEHLNAPFFRLEQ
jgi:hypothetical protein